jgi:hypothetical protein
MLLGQFGIAEVQRKITHALGNVGRLDGSSGLLGLLLLLLDTLGVLDVIGEL